VPVVRYAKLRLHVLILRRSGGYRYGRRRCQLASLAPRPETSDRMPSRLRQAPQLRHRMRHLSPERERFTDRRRRAHVTRISQKSHAHHEPRFACESLTESALARVFLASRGLRILTNALGGGESERSMAIGNARVAETTRVSARSSMRFTRPLSLDSYECLTNGACNRHCRPYGSGVLPRCSQRQRAFDPSTPFSRRRAPVKPGLRGAAPKRPVPSVALVDHCKCRRRLAAFFALIDCGDSGTAATAAASAVAAAADAYASSFRTMIMDNGTK
jgi:hypothetical protein